MESLEDIKKMYKLSEDEHDKIQQYILRIYFDNKAPVANPKAIIDIAPPASGKTGLNGYGTNEFIDNNVIIINSDELKPYHPKIEEISRRYPQYFTKITDQESNTWTSTLFDEALKKGYNVIFEGTGKNSRILNTIRDKMHGYNVIVRGMAVNELNCLISIIERYEGQLSRKGFGRLVTQDHFYETYNNMPNTIDEIEKSGLVDRVEVFRRGKEPTQPIKIYSSDEDGKYGNAKYAVLGGRSEDIEDAKLNFQRVKVFLYNLSQRENQSREELEMISKILEIEQEIESKKKMR